MLDFMLVWRAFIFSMAIALFAAITSPACATENNSAPLNLVNDVAYSQAISDSDTVVNDSALQHNSTLGQALLADVSLFKRSKSPQLPDNTDEDRLSGSKKPTFQVRFNHNVSLPPFERQAASAFGSVFQNEPSFVLVYEFLPEILGLKHFLAPLTTHISVPWYLRADVSNSHSRLAGWKDGNAQYTAAITYLS